MTVLRFILASLAILACEAEAEPGDCEVAVDCPGDRVCRDGQCLDVCRIGGAQCCEPAPELLPEGLGVCEVQP